MLESLGYAEAPERDEADLILFNTCSIRETADEPFVAHLREAKARQARAPETSIGVGGCWAQSVKEEVFALPVRRRRLRPRPGPQAGRVPDHRLAHRPGLLRVRGLHRAPAGEARRASSRAGCRSPSAATGLLVLHRAVHARPRGLAAARRARRRGRADGRRRRARGHAARPERQLLRARPAAARRRVRGAAARASTRSTGIERIRYTSPHPKDMREDVDPRARRAAALCEHIHLPLQSGSRGS